MDLLTKMVDEENDINDSESAPKLGIVRNSKGQFEKGHSGNVNAAIHKKTLAVKDFLASFAEEKMHEIPTLWQDLSSKDKLNMLFKIISINTPMENQGSATDQPITITFTPAPTKKEQPRNGDSD